MNFSWISITRIWSGRRRSETRPLTDDENARVDKVFAQADRVFDEADKMFAEADKLFKSFGEDRGG